MKSPILWKIGENEVWMGKEIRELAFAFSQRQKAAAFPHHH